MMTLFSTEITAAIIAVLQAIVILLVVVICGALMSFGERRLLALFQNRYGPNRVGWGGSLQIAADMIKCYLKKIDPAIFR